MAMGVKDVLTDSVKCRRGLDALGLSDEGGTEAILVSRTLKKKFELCVRICITTVRFFAGLRVASTGSSTTDMNRVEHRCPSDIPGWYPTGLVASQSEGCEVSE